MKTLAAELATMKAIEVDTLVVENIAPESLTTGYGLTEFGASWDGDYYTSSQCAALEDHDDII